MAISPKRPGNSHFCGEFAGCCRQFGVVRGGLKTCEFLPPSESQFPPAYIYFRTECPGSRREDGEEIVRHLQNDAGHGGAELRAHFGIGPGAIAILARE